MTSPEPSAFSLRVATPDDAPLLAELGARLFEQTFGTENDPADMRAYLGAAFNSARMEVELNAPAIRIWIAEDSSGTAIGYAVLRRGSANRDVRAQVPAEVTRIYVDQSGHGRGVGRALMDACIAQAREWTCDVIWLGVWERNARAIAFYKRYGFEIVGETTFQLGRDRQRDHVMARPLVG